VSISELIFKVIFKVTEVFLGWWWSIGLYCRFRVLTHIALTWLCKLWKFFFSNVYNIPVYNIQEDNHKINVSFMPNILRLIFMINRTYCICCITLQQRCKFYCHIVTMAQCWLKRYTIMSVIGNDKFRALFWRITENTACGKVCILAKTGE